MTSGPATEPSKTGETIEVDGTPSKTDTAEVDGTQADKRRVIPTPVRPPLLKAHPKSKGTPSGKTKLKIKTAAKTKAKKKTEKSPKSTQKTKEKKPKTSPPQKTAKPKQKDEIEKKLHSVSNRIRNTLSHSCH